MSISLIHNTTAMNAARNLNTHYAGLKVSIERLSSGLRVSTAAHDPSGLAMRELMRADVVALRQGVRNANDAISLLQTADGALGVIDEKLIRMKELAEQAATGTYNSDQRAMINDEFQAMGEEINRIATSTDFNGIYLLDGSRAGGHDGSGMESTGSLKVHFGTGNDAAEDYYYLDIGSATIAGLGLVEGAAPGAIRLGDGAKWLLNEATINWDTNTIALNIQNRAAGLDYNSPQGIQGFGGQDFYALLVGLKNVRASSVNADPLPMHKPHINLFDVNGTMLVGVSPNKSWLAPEVSTYPQPGYIWWNYGFNPGIANVGDDVVRKLSAAGVLNPDAKFDDSSVLTTAGASRQGAGSTVTLLTNWTDYYGVWETLTIDEITSELAFTVGGHSNGYCNPYNLTITADMTPELKEALQNAKGGGAPPPTPLIKIDTQEKAQQAIESLDRAIIKKDQIRANIGAYQNRLENTVSNLRIQAENVSRAESQISDIDISSEMTNFVRNQIKAQAGVAMLSQANSLPKMALALLQG